VQGQVNKHKRHKETIKSVRCNSRGFNSSR
jgi:hypothetical protein